jgi:hypothetical protein
MAVLLKGIWLFVIALIQLAIDLNLTITKAFARKLGKIIIAAFKMQLDR